MSKVDIAQILALLIQLMSIGPDYWRRLVDTFHQSGELSDEEWKALKDRIDAAFAAPHWQPDAEGEL